MAIEDSLQKALPVKEIYAWIIQHFPYFKTAPTGWKNSVRHNLSLNKCFQKVEKAAVSLRHQSARFMNFWFWTFSFAAESGKRILVDGRASIPAQLDSGTYSLALSCLFNMGEARKESYQDTKW